MRHTPADDADALETTRLRVRPAAEDDLEGAHVIDPAAARARDHDGRDQDRAHAHIHRGGAVGAAVLSTLVFPMAALRVRGDPLAAMAADPDTMAADI